MTVWVCDRCRPDMICSCTVLDDTVPAFCPVDAGDSGWQEFHPETDGRFC
jgi:hypothetical protein